MLINPARVGWDVSIFERSAHDLDSRGGGIVLQPEVVEVFRRASVDIQTINLGVRSQYRTVLRPDGSIQSKHLAPQTQTSWSLVYTTLKAAMRCSGTRPPASRPAAPTPLAATTAPPRKGA